MIKRIIPWTSQPQIPVEIDRSNPLAVPFTSFLYPATGGKLFDACASPLQNSVSTTITPGVFVGGRNFEFNGTTSGVNFGDVETVNFAGAYSIFVLFRPDAQTGARREMLLAKDVLGGRQFSIELNPKGTSGSTVGQTGAIGHTRWSSGAAFYQKYSNANVVANGNWYSLLIGSTDGSTDIVAYLNGADLSLSAGTGSATGLVVNTTTALTAGRRAYVGAEDYFDGAMAAIGIANVAPSVSLAKALYENPYQLLKKQHRNIYVSVAGGGAITADASITQASNTSSSTASLVLSADASITAGADTASSTALLSIAADSSITQDGNTITSTASLVADTITADASITQDSNTSTADGSLSIVADAAVTQSGNTLTSTAALASDTITANADITQAINTVTADGVISIGAGASITQDGDSITFDAALVLAAEASITQAGNTLTSSAGSNAWAGEPFNFASPITRTFGFTSSVTKNLNFESPI